MGQWLVRNESSRLSIALSSALRFVGLILYEHLLTLHQEVTFIWWRKRSLGTVLFAANRYVALLYSVLTVCANFVHSQSGCHFVSWVQQGAMLLLMLISGGVRHVSVFCLY